MSGSYRWGGPSGGESRIYVGNLPTDVRIRDIEDIFYKYGKIRDIDLKNKRGSAPFAFVEFEDPRILSEEGVLAMALSEFLAVL